MFSSQSDTSILDTQMVRLRRVAVSASLPLDSGWYIIQFLRVQISICETSAGVEDISTVLVLRNARLWSSMAAEDDPN